MTPSKKAENIWKLSGLGSAAGPGELEIQDANLEIKQGDRVAILCEKPSTRSLLLRILAGLRPVRIGSLEIFERKTRKLEFFEDWDQIFQRSVRQKLGVCLEIEGLVSNVSVREGMELLYRFKSGHESGRSRTQVAEQVQKTCDLFEISNIQEKRPFMLTTSERRLAGIARAWVSEPETLLLEEPTRGLNEKYRKILWRVFQNILSSPEQTLVASTDDWIFAHAFCTRWIVFENSRIVFDGKPSDFFKGKFEILNEVRELKELRGLLDGLLGEIA